MIHEKINMTKVITVKAICDCGGTFMRDMSKDHSSFGHPPKKFTYECNMCGKVVESTKKYPYTYVE